MVSFCVRVLRVIRFIPIKDCQKIMDILFYAVIYLNLTLFVLLIALLGSLPISDLWTKNRNIPVSDVTQGVNMT